MKCQLSFITFFVFSLHIAIQAEAQFNFSQKARQPTILLGYSNSDFTVRSKSLSHLFSSLSLPRERTF